MSLYDIMMKRFCHRELVSRLEVGSRESNHAREIIRFERGKNLEFSSPSKYISNVS